MRVLLNILKSKIKNQKPDIATRAAYDLWASSYPPTAHNPVMRAEQAAMLQLWPNVRGKHALDLACGTGRYTQIMLERGAASVVALDFSAEMLRHVGAHLSVRPSVMRPSAVRATMMQVPLAAASFDVIVSGLAVGHAADLSAWMSECARVLRHDGTLLYSDFHPRAAQVGMKRTFRADDGRTITVPHNTFTLDAHQRAAHDASLTIETMSEVRAGIELREEFDGSAEFYRRWHGTPLVLVVRIVHKETGRQGNR
jgi:malonyl-CoA O-methyltransferase